MPVIRPMALAFQADREAARHIYQFMYGPDLLVAPMYQPGTRRTVYLPAGWWTDYWTGVMHEGGGVIEVDAPLRTMPLFVRAGAILPTLPEGVETLVERHAGMDPDVIAMTDSRVIEVWAGPSGEMSSWDGLRARLGTPAGGFEAAGGTVGAGALGAAIAFEGRGTARGDVWMKAVDNAAVMRMLTVSSDRLRPVEVRLIGRRLPELRVDGATVRVDAANDRTIISFDALHGQRLIQWAERWCRTDEGTAAAC
jgi:hypothetical protein